MRKHLGVALAAVTLVALTASAASGQSLLERAKQKAKEKAAEQLDKKTEKAPEKVQKEPEASVKPAASSGEAATATPAADAPGGAPARPAVNVGKDFTPGTRVVFATDFKRDEVGDFPRAFELKSGNFEVADVGGTRYLRATSFGQFELPLPEVLPEMFTVEFDLKPVSGWTQYLYFTDERGKRPHVEIGAYSGGIEGPGGYRVQSDVENKDPANRIFHIQVMADGKYVKVYMDGQRVANAPNADLGRSNKLTFNISADAKHPVLIGNFRIAAGGKDLYKALEATGRVTAEGIFFDTNSDRLRPESEPVLKQIGDMLAQHQEMKLGIEGHTDNVGAAAANQALSEKRAAAVKAYLVQKFQVDAARLSSQGFGPTKPVAPNDDEAGRQQNRRVELVKM